MIYNLELFGEKLKEIRKALKLNQMEITELTNVDDKTIRRVEHGKVLPKLDTLELLSPIYKEDLISLLLEYRLNKGEYIESLETSICLCKSFGQEQLRNTIINNCKEFLGIDL